MRKYSYGDMEGVKSLLQLNEQEYYEMNDNLIEDSLLVANDEIMSYLITLCKDDESIPDCDSFFLDNIANLYAVSYVWLSTASMQDINTVDKANSYYDRAENLLDKYMNTLRRQCNTSRTSSINSNSHSFSSNCDNKTIRRWNEIASVRCKCKHV